MIIAVSVLRYPQDPEKGNHGMFRTPVPGLYVKGGNTGLVSGKQFVLHRRRILAPNEKR